MRAQQIVPAIVTDITPQAPRPGKSVLSTGTRIGFGEDAEERGLTSHNAVRVSDPGVFGFTVSAAKASPRGLFELENLGAKIFALRGLLGVFCS